MSKFIKRLQDDFNRGHTPTPEEATEGYQPLEAEIESEKAHIFPPDNEPAIEIGGSPGEQAALDEEYRR